MESRTDTDTKEPYWKVKDTVENLFFNQKFETSFKAHQFANLENGGRYPPRCVVIRFSPKGAGKGWRENPDASGKAPIHKEVATRAQAKHAQNTPLNHQNAYLQEVQQWEKNSRDALSRSRSNEKRERHIKSLIEGYLEKGYSPGSAKIMAEIDYNNIFKSEREVAAQVPNAPTNHQKPSHIVIQSINSMPIQKDTIELTGITSVTSPQNFQPIQKLTLGDTLYFYYDQPFRVVKKSGSIEILPKDSRGHFIIGEDSMGSITLSHSKSKKEAFFQAESDTDAVKDLLTKTEKEDLESGWTVEIPDYEPRASSLQEMFEAGGGD